jgi:hypothetical protein
MSAMAGGYSRGMTMNQQDTQKLTQNWDQVKNQVRSQFPGLQDSDYESGRTDPEAFIRTAAQKSGKSEDEVRTALTSAAQSAGQTQTQR